MERWEYKLDITKRYEGSYTPQVAEYAVASHIDQEPAFAWWIPHVIRKKEAIISKVKSAYWLTTHKYGKNTQNSSRSTEP